MKNNIPPQALYLHIPFCAKKCNYCDFNSVVTESKIVDRYLLTIEKELQAFDGRYVFSTVYVGGGTPSVLSESQLERLLSNIIRHIPASQIREYTVEANPGTLTAGKVSVLKEYRVNRMSLGVQSFQDGQLNFLGRIHSSNDAKDAFALLRRHGFENINVDLIFGCPGQTLNAWKSDLETVLSLQPEHVSTYSLTYEDGTPLAGDLKSEAIRALDEEVELEMYKTAIRLLSGNGYNHYEISNFAKDGFLCSHNCVYWKNMGYVGVGAGAYSFVDGERTSNEKDVLKYIDGIQENRNIKSFRERLRPDRFASETVVMALRLRQGVSNADFYGRFGHTIDGQFGDQIQRLLREGLISYENERMKLTDKGLFVADTVMAEFV